MKPIYWREVMDADPDKFVLIDVRTSMEFSAGAIPGAINIPLDDMRSRLDEIPTDKPIVLYCGVGLRGYLASNILRHNGYEDVRNLIGGIKTYRTAVSSIPAPKPFTKLKKRIPQLIHSKPTRPSELMHAAFHVRDL